MSNLMLLMAAGLAIGNGPANIPGDLVEQLDLSGNWEGTAPSSFPQLVTQVEVAEGRIRFHGEGITILTTPWKVIDEGNGRLRIEWKAFSTASGIYRWSGNRLIICYRHAGKGLPTQFRVGGGNSLLILRRVGRSN
jgi:hypothetical protein